MFWNKESREKKAIKKAEKKAEREKRREEWEAKMAKEETERKAKIVRENRARYKLYEVTLKNGQTKQIVYFTKSTNLAEHLAEIPRHATGFVSGYSINAYPLKIDISTILGVEMLGECDDAFHEKIESR